ncbi:MAG: hypothetical protein Q7R75_00475 [bacterium]|nr:hypothetical protein [bacterium]
MNKNTIIAIVTLVALAAGILLYMRNINDLSAFSFEKERTVVDNWSVDVDVFDFSEELIAETNRTVSDILDEQSSVNSENALNENTLGAETNQANLSQAFSDLNADNAALQESEQSLNELTQ